MFVKDKYKKQDGITSKMFDPILPALVYPGLARNRHGLIKLWYINYRSLSQKIIILWNTHQLILHRHDIRSWNMKSCYLADLNGSSNNNLASGQS